MKLTNLLEEQSKGLWHNIRAKKTIFRSKKKNNSVISGNLLLGLLSMSVALAAVSFIYFDTDIEAIEPRKNLNSITIDFPTSLIENSILIESSDEESFMSCEYFVQIGAYGNKKYAPTYLKTTVFNNWGRSNEIKKTTVYKMTLKDQKTQLFKINTY